MFISEAQRIGLNAVQAAVASRLQMGHRGGRLPGHLRRAVIALVGDGLSVDVVAGESGT